MPANNRIAVQGPLGFHPDQSRRKITQTASERQALAEDPFFKTPSGCRSASFPGLDRHES